MQGEQPTQQPSQPTPSTETLSDANGANNAGNAGSVDGANGVNAAKAHKHKSVELRLPMPAVTFRESRRGNPNAGDVRVHIVHGDHSSDTVFKHVSRGVLEATEEADVPEDSVGKFTYYAKRFLIGAPIATAMSENERLTRFKALAVLSSDAISSVAYATEAILINLVAAGSGVLGLTLPISLVIIALLCIVAISYRQTIPAYPNGGGSYIVARENLGTLPGLVAAAALLIDYVLNVAVSVAAGVQNLASLLTGLSHYVVWIDVALVIFITLVNLRGVRESGSIFALPTYFFVVSAILLILVGIVKAFLIGHQPVIGQFAPVAATDSALLSRARLIRRRKRGSCSSL